MASRPPYKMDRFPQGTTQREAAFVWLAKNRHIWVGRNVARYEPMRVSPAWLEVVLGLQEAGIYSIATCAWDARVENLVHEFLAIERAS